MRQSKNASCSGFTLVELLVTVAIVGILASLAIANFAEIKDSVRRVEISVLHGHVETGIQGIISAYLPSEILSVAAIMGGWGHLGFGDSYYIKNGEKSQIPNEDLMEFIPEPIYSGSDRDIMLIFAHEVGLAPSTTHFICTCHCKITTGRECLISNMDASSGKIDKGWRDFSASICPDYCNGGPS